MKLPTYSFSLVRSMRNDDKTADIEGLSPSLEHQLAAVLKNVLRLISDYARCYPQCVRQKPLCTFSGPYSLKAVE